MPFDTKTRKQPGYLYRVPRSVIELSERAGVPVELVVTACACKDGPEEYRQDIMSLGTIHQTLTALQVATGGTGKTNHSTETTGASGETVRCNGTTIRHLALPDPVRGALFAMARNSHKGERMYRPNVVYGWIAQELAKHATITDLPGFATVAGKAHLMKAERPRPYMVRRTLIDDSRSVGVRVDATVSLIALRFGPDEYRQDILQSLGLSDADYRQMMPPRAVAHSARKPLGMSRRPSTNRNEKPSSTPAAASVEKPLKMRLVLDPTVRKSLHDAGYEWHPIAKFSRLGLYECIAEFLDDSVRQTVAPRDTTRTVF